MIKSIHVELSCLNCKIIYFKPPSIARQGKQKFCCKICLQLFRASHGMTGDGIKKTKRNCIVCLKDFYANNSELKRSPCLYCSKKCMDHGKSEIKKCLKCEKEFKVYLSTLKRKGGKYCSKNCSNDPRTIEQRFWDAIIKNKSQNHCWSWKLKVDKNNYGIFFDGKKNIRAHRFSYQLHFGSIPDGLIICHKCDNPICSNPDHLYAGTYLDNARDRDRKYKKTT